ncbi:vascular endothelial growth factor receptor 1-like isoform X2 [Anopheles albimanus]|uniref:Receptor protein-tyrosine kinase n=1 Tax=Anopheles albimanus TaxID=7167 RepID=A0A8W7JBN7_ANOAL|nr:vascular endothelial growth factor receptor 1-like isoform X2 [Anopheles albimanus]
MFRALIKFSLVIAILSVMIQMLDAKADNDIFVVEDYEPELVPPDETTNLTVGYVVLDFGINWNITCTSDKPIVWTYFEPAYEWEPDVTIINFQLENVYRPYRSELLIKSASAASVGRYYCVNSDAWKEHQKVLLDALVTENTAVTLYVYVNDPDQHLIPLNGGLTFIVYPHENVTFPCKPSLPWINPALCVQNDTCYNITDPTKGFILHYEIFKLKKLSLCCNVNDTTVYNMSLFVAQRRKLLVPLMKGDETRTAFLGESIKLSCSFMYEWHVPEIRWKVPPYSLHIRKDERVRISRLDVKKNSTETDEYLSTQELFIEKATYQDDGNYRCEVSTDDNFLYDSYNLYVRQSGNHYVKLMEKTKTGIINWKLNETSSTLPIEISVQYRSYPREISYTWYKNNDEIIINDTRDSKYIVKKSKYNIKLTIQQPTVHDTNLYSVIVYAANVSKRCNVSVFAYTKPTVQLTSIEAGPYETVQYVCSSTGYPLPEMQLWFKPCDDIPWQNCSIEETRTTGWNETENERKDTLISTNRTYPILANQSGVVYCAAQNTEGNETARADLLVSDLIRQRFDMKRVHPQTIATVGDNVTISCLAVVYYYENKIFFEYKGKKLIKSDRIGASDVRYIGNPSYVWEANFTIKNANLRDSGNISCFLKNRNGARERKDFDLTVVTPSAAEIDNHLNRESLSFELNDTLVLDCVTRGVPEPQVRWFKINASEHEELIPEKNNINVTIRKQKYRSVLSIDSLLRNNSGMYKCEAENKRGKVSKFWTVSIRPVWLKEFMIFSIVSLLLSLIAAIVLFIHFYYKKKKEVEAMKAAGLANFEEGNLDCYNPALALNEQADLLPYNADYEFPMESLVLLEQLGSGAYGVVMKAKAIGIKENESETTVAVKMIKKQADSEAILALVTELKIMIHLGQHVNVVNLLGAVTKNISKRKLMVIVEFCPLGSVQDFLLKRRAHFIDQIIPETGEINRLRRSESGNLYNSQGLKYVTLYFGTKNTVSTRDDAQGESSQEEYPKKRSAVRNVECTSDLQYVPMNSRKNTKGSVFPMKTAHCVEEYINMDVSNEGEESTATMKTEDPVRTVNTTDLICWAAQVACGMEYLASRNVLHGDLAARNVLLCHDNVVKICDFGLARSMYKCDKYKKKQEALLPFKWLALECISDHVFSTFSDIWAYGVFLWELFSLAKSPYPGMDANEELYNKLLQGYRLEKPRYANQAVYDIMLPCWNETPDSRPSFQELKNQFNAMLPDEIREHISKLNEPYVRLNAEKIKRGVKDYLANIVSDKVASFPPDYVNFTASTDVPDEQQHNYEKDLNMTCNQKDKASEIRKRGEMIEMSTRCETISKESVQLPSMAISCRPISSHNSDSLESDDTDDDKSSKLCPLYAVSNPGYITFTKGDGSHS